MSRSDGQVAAASRDAHLTLRRVERQQHLVERLHSSAVRLTFERLANDLGVSERTISRDIDRLRDSGVPITVVPGPGGGAFIEHSAPVAPITFDLPEVASLMASLAAVGPSTSDSAASAMRKLAASLHTAN